jgi:hypothetical protein
VSAPLSRVAAIATLGGVPAVFAATVVLARSAGGHVSAEFGDAMWLAIPFGAFGLVGVLILWRRPGHVVGAICAGLAWLYTVTGFAIAYAGWGVAGSSPRPGTVLAIWVGNWTWYPILGVASVALPLLIPDGRLPSRRWRWVVVLGSAAVAGIVVFAMLHPQLTTFEDEATIPNPIGVAGVPSPIDSIASNVLLVGLGVAFAGAVASIIVRYRRADTEDRARLKWILFAFALVLVINLSLDLVQHRYLPDGISNAIWAVVWLILPVGIGIAVLRHRLFDIDRIVSRTVSYAVVTTVLAGLFVAGVVGLGGVLRALTGGAGGDLVVAGSTLLVAAAFGPVHRRARSAVDRRFNRARYDAQHTVAAFAQRLRDEVDLDLLAVDLRGVTVQAVQPAHASLWLRSPEPSS